MSNKLRLTGKQYNSWKEEQKKDEDQTFINPLTNREIQRGKGEYNALEKLALKYEKDNNFTYEECLVWEKNPEFNPKTGRKIVIGEAVYERLRQACDWAKTLNSNQEIKNKTESENISQNSKVKKIFSLLCVSGQSKCMMKDCKSTGYYGINFDLMNKPLKQIIFSLQPNIPRQNCCCFCFGHFFTFSAFMSSQFLANCRLNKNLEKINPIQVQKVADTLNESRLILPVNTGKFIMQEFNKMFLRFTKYEFTSNFPIMSYLTAYVQDNISSDNFNYITNSISNMISSSCQRDE